MNVSSIAPSQSPQACPQALPPLRRGGWGGRPLQSPAPRLATAEDEATQITASLPTSPPPLFKGGPGGGVMKIIRPTASEMPPVLLRKRPLAQPPHPNPPPQGDPQGGRGFLAASAAKKCNKNPRVQRRVPPRFGPHFHHPSWGVPPFDRPHRARAARKTKPRQSPQACPQALPPLRRGGRGGRPLQSPPPRVPRLRVVNPASLILIGFSRCRDGPALVCNR